MCVRHCRFPFFLVGGFVVDTYGKWEHLNPEGNGEIVPERAIWVAMPVTQGMEPGRTHESTWVGSRGSTRGCHHPPGDHPPLLSRQKSRFHCTSKKNTLGMILFVWLRTERPVVLDHRRSLQQWKFFPGGCWRSALEDICLFCMHSLLCFRCLFLKQH